MASRPKGHSVIAHYEQASGLFEIWAFVDGSNTERCVYQSVGYAGRGIAKNDPEAQCRVGEGPIPRGVYRIAGAQDHPRLGPLAFRLTPLGANAMCGRSGFFIHADSRGNPGNASHGCIVLTRAAREALVHHRVRLLEVVRGVKVPDFRPQAGD